MSNPNHRNFVIDCIRGSSIILVVGIHYFDMMHFVYPQIYRDGGWINTVFGHGYYGVTIFFVISGYLISSSNVKLNDRAHNYVEVKKFYVKRATRIIPLVALVVSLSALILYGVGINKWNPYVYAYQVGMAGYGLGFWSAIALFYFNWLEIAWVPYNDGWFGLQWNILWSLAVEEQFYLMFPWLIFLTKTQRNALYAAAFMVVLAFGIRAVLIAKGAAPAVVYDNSFSCFDALLIGVALGLSNPSSPVVSKILLIGGPLLFLGLYLLPYYALSGFPVLGVAIAAGMMIHGSRQLEGSKPPWVLIPLCQLGSLSYGAYLLHPPALLIVFYVMDILEPLPWPGFIASLLLTFALAKFSFAIFERPVEKRLRARLIGSGYSQRKAGSVEASADNESDRVR